MADNFNMKQFLMENKLGAYSRLKETEEGYMGTQYDSSEDMAVDMVKKGITEYEVIYVVRDGRCYRKDDEGNMDEVNMSYCKRFAEGEEKEIEEAIDAKSFGGILKSDNPEGDALVLRFLQGIAKKFEYPVSHAAMFVKERIKKLGY